MRALIEQQPGFVVCAEAENPTAAVELARTSKPTIAIVDISLRGENGLELVAALKKEAAHMPVLVVSMHDEEFYAARAQHAGAVGYVMKQHASERILAALHRILAGQTAFRDPQRPEAWINPARAEVSDGGLSHLSAREREVLALLGAGYGTREVAEQLKLSVKTIDSYREHLKEKLNISSGERLVQFAVRWANSQARAAERS